MKKYFLAIFCLSIAFHPLHALAQVEESKKIVQAMEDELFRTESDILRKIFIHYAKKGDVEKMIGFTSPITRKNTGESETARIYKESYVPIFQRYDEQPEACEEKPVQRSDGARGWRFACRLTNKVQEQMFVAFWIFEEGKIYVASILFVEPT